MRTYRFLLPHSRPYWRSYLLGVLLIPFSIASALLIPWFTGEAVELLQRGGWQPGELRLCAGAILALALARTATLFAVRWLLIGASRKVEFDLRNRLFAHLQTLDQSFYNDARTGDIMSRATSDIERARLLVGPVVMYAAQTAAMLALAVPLMLSVSVSLTVLVMVPLSLLTLAVRKIGPRVHAEVFKAQETLADLSSLAQEDFAGIRVVKSFAQEEAEGERFLGVARAYLAQNLRAARISAWMHPIVAAVADLALVLLLLAGGILILDGFMDLGGFIKFAGYQSLLMWPMISIGWVVNQFHRGSASVERLRELFDLQPLVEEPPSPRLPPSRSISGEISIRGLTFSYGARPVLRDVDIHVPQGATVAVVGRTGAGKSTLIQLLPRLLPPPRGTVFIDGIDVNELPLGLLRRSIGLVPQESFLFSRTIRENVAFGLEAPAPGEIESAAAVARFDKDIDQFPRGYDEIVGERGVTLSGGQKQRAAIARALLVRPRILLLDDALSAVDTETEKEIVRNVREATRNLTSLIVSHRISSILHADHIYVLDEGRVAEEGTHAELVARGRLYADLYRRQLLSEELEKL